MKVFEVFKSLGQDKCIIYRPGHTKGHKEGNPKVTEIFYDSDQYVNQARVYSDDNTMIIINNPDTIEYVNLKEI